MVKVTGDSPCSNWKITKNLRYPIKAVYTAIIFLLVILPLVACQSSKYKDKGDVVKVKFIRNFHNAIINSDYITAINCTCEAQEAKKKGNFGIGEQEIEFMRTKFPWNDLKLLQVTEIVPNYYELKFEGKSGIKMQDLAIDQKNGSLCIYLQL
ncbi:MAG: hypothetical protein FJ242_00080 [Nitrospira sp.]|nr:hypothetical protein [Nitrospira sp.]